MKLDIACGQKVTEGFVGIDLAEDADIKHDLFSFPWPIEDDSVEEIICSHFVEHIPHWRPEWGNKDGWFMFWDEVYRICKPDAVITVIHPYVMNSRAFWDPTHTRFISETTWYYLSAEWRKQYSLDHYDTMSDFETISINGRNISESVIAMPDEEREFARKHFWNVMEDLEVILKRK